MSAHTDQELMELAAKAAEPLIQMGRFGPGQCWLQPDEVLDGLKPWNPLTDDGDALRLAVKLNIDFYSGNDEGAATFAGYFIGTVQKYTIVQHGDDPYAATRRAIVRAAAEIGGAA